MGDVWVLGLKAEPFDFYLHTIEDEPKVGEVGDKIGELICVAVVEWGNCVEGHERLREAMDS